MKTGLVQEGDVREEGEREVTKDNRFEFIWSRSLVRLKKTKCFPDQKGGSERIFGINHLRPFTANTIVDGRGYRERLGKVVSRQFPNGVGSRCRDPRSICLVQYVKVRTFPVLN